MDARVKNTEAWPQWPRLPMIKRTGHGLPQTGFLLADQVDADGPITLHRGNIFVGATGKTEEFVSLEALFDTGWRVD